MSLTTEFGGDQLQGETHVASNLDAKLTTPNPINPVNLKTITISDLKLILKLITTTKNRLNPEGYAYTKMMILVNHMHQTIESIQQYSYEKNKTNHTHIKNKKIQQQLNEIDNANQFLNNLPVD